MLVVDTNVAAYFLIEGDQTPAARELHGHDSDWRSEPFLLVEFTNVLASSIATKRMTIVAGEKLLANANALFRGKLGSVPHADVLATAVRFRVSAYDARFLTLAEQLHARLVTEDVRLRMAVPALTQSIAEALAAV